MSAAAPWSVKGIDPKAREVAKDLARRSGMTLGEWLNSMIMEDNDDDDVVPLARRPHVEVHERRGRSRRLEDAYGVSDETVQRLGASLEAIAARLEASERRATVAIQGVDQAVGGLVRRLDGSDVQAQDAGRRIDDIAQDLREGHRRLRRFEQETGPQIAEGFAKVETSVGGLASRLYDIEERQRSGVSELRQRLDAVEKAQPASQPANQGADVLAQVGARLDEAQARTTEALRRLERSFGDLDTRVSEGRTEPEGARFEKLAESLSRQVETSRAEMMRRLDTAEAETRIDRIERAVSAMGEQVHAAERRSAEAVEAMGREILRIARNLDTRVEQVEGAGGSVELGQALTARIDRDFARHAQAVDQRLADSDARHAQAIERLGGEITRISDRLGERIAQSERRSAEALEDIGRRLADRSDRLEQRHERASGELADRMRQSEERTARLLSEARDSIERRADARPAPRPEPTADWRSAAFPEDAFGPLDPPAAPDWSRDPLDDAAPFPAAADPLEDAFVSRASPEAEFEPQPETEPALEPVAETLAPTPFGVASEPAFGGADVSDALEAGAEPSVEDDFVVEPEFDKDEFEETEFVDRDALRAAAAAGRAASTEDAPSTLDAVQAARAAMTSADASRDGFGLKRGGKSQLQQRLDRQAARDGSTVRRALVVSTLAAAVTAGGYGYTRVAGEFGLPLPAGWAEVFEDATAPAPANGAPIAALASTSVAATPMLDPTEGANLYTRATRLMSEGDPTALETLKRAANLGYPPAQLHLAGLYQDGVNGAPIDKPEARLWARRAAEGGDAKGMHAYAMYLFDGMGGPANQGEAVDWLKKAAEQGFVDSQFNLAKIYEDGRGVAANPGEALKWYAIAARGGDQQAQAALDRLTPDATPQARQAARRAADDFQAAPLKG